jgi:hypothetical protein
VRSFARVVDGAARAPLARAPIAALPRAETMAASFAEERLWFLDRLEAGRGAYTIPAAFRVRGELDVRALACAVEALVARHEALRTSYVEIDGVPRQRFASASEVGTLVVDASADGPIEEVVTREAAEPFALETGPLFRARLVRIAEDDHVLLLTLHHAVADGWSVAVLLRDLSELYAGTARAALSVQAADYAAWLRAPEQAARHDEGLAHFREALAGATPLDLPTDRPHRRARATPVRRSRWRFRRRSSGASRRSRTPMARRSSWSSSRRTRRSSRASAGRATSPWGRRSRTASGPSSRTWWGSS